MHIKQKLSNHEDNNYADSISATVRMFKNTTKLLVFFEVNTFWILVSQWKFLEAPHRSIKLQ